MAKPVSFLRTSREEPSPFDLLSTSGQISPEEQYALRPESQFSRGLRLGAVGLTAGSLANEALNQEVAGSPDWQRSRDLARQALEQGQTYALRVPSLRDIHSIGDAADYAAGTLGQGLMTVAPTLATALITRGRGSLANAGSLAGGAATAYNIERGEAALNQYTDPTLAATPAEERARAATAKGAINAGLEALVPAGLAGSLLRRPAGSLMGHVGREMLKEGATEGTQQAVGFDAEKYLDPNRQLDPWDIADAVAAGALTGGTMSGAMRAPAHGAQALADRLQRGQQSDNAPVDLNQPSDLPSTGGLFDTLGEQARRAKDYVSDTFDTLNERFGPTIREQAQRTKDYASDTFDTLGEQARRAKDYASDAFERFGPSIQEQARRAKDYASDAFDTIPEDVADTARRAKDYVSDTFDTLNERFGPAVKEKAQRAKDYVSDTVARMTEAAKTAQTPSDFLRQVFGNSAEEAAADLVPDTEDPVILNAADPAAALRQRDVDRQQRAARFAEELLNDPATPNSVRERVASFNGDFSSREAQTFVTRNLVAMRAGEKLANAVTDLIDLSKDLGNKARDAVNKGAMAAVDRIVKKNLQDATPAEQAAFNRLIFDNLTDEAKANPVVRQRLPEIANAMLAFAARTGDVTKDDLKTLARLQDGLTIFRDPDAVAAQLVEYAGIPRTEDSFLSRIKRVTNAQQDVRKPNNFLYMSLTDEAKSTLTPAQLKQLARLVDEFSLSDRNKAQGDKVLAGLTAAFGSKENAQAVLDYYQQQNRADVRFDPNETLVGGSLTERDSAPAPTYQFADAKTMRPFRVFAGSTLNEGGMRQLLREATIAGIALRRSSPDGARVRPIRMSKYVKDTGRSPEAEVKRIAADIMRRIEEHKARKGEDRTKQINGLRGELTLLREVYRSRGAQAALNLYEVLEASEKDQNDLVATDEDISKMALLADAKDARETRVTFQRTDGSKFTLSAESMWKMMGDKEGYGKSEPLWVRAKRLFSEAVAAVLARPDVAKMITPMEDILIDRRLKMRGEKKDNPEYRAMVANALKAAEGSLKALQATLDDVVDEYSDLVHDDLKYGEYSLRRDTIEAILDQNILRLSSRLDAARMNKGPLAGNKPAQIVAREKLRMYRETQDLIEGIKFDAEREYTDENRSGIPGERDNNLPYAHLNTENRGRSTESAAPVSRPGAISDKTMATLYDIAVKGNVQRLDTPDRVLLYVATARDAMNQLEQTPENSLTAMQRELLAKLRADFDQSGAPAFDWNKLLDGMNPTDEQRRTLKNFVSKKSAMGAEKGSLNDADRQRIIDEIRRIRGDKIEVLFQKFSEIGGSGEFSMNKDKTNRLIKIAVNASNPMGAAWHESLHDFFAMLGEDQAGRSIKKDLIDASEAPQVKRRLRELLAKHPEALKQIEESPEERVAYMYQFWAEGLLRLGPTGTSIFERVRQLFRDLFGLVSTSERAEDLLTALHEGRFAEPSTVAEVLADMPTDRFYNKVRKASPELANVLSKVVNTAPDRLRAYQNDTLTKLADMFSSERGELGFIQRRFQQQGIWENKLFNILANTTAQERRAALDNMQAMKPPSSKLEMELANFFSEMHDYMVRAGVKTLDSKSKTWIPLRKVKDYFPRVFDRHALLADREGFISLLQKYGNMGLKQANATFDALVHGTGQLDLAENEHALGFTPYAQAVQDRRFTFINPSNASEFAKYQVKDLADITTGYVKQAVHRAEYARMFGNDGEVITKMVDESGIRDPEELEDIGKTIQGLEGSLGNDMSASTKELLSGVMTLQNLVLLPLSLFSQMIDPIVLAARSEDIRDAGNAYITAIKRMVGKKVDGEELAKMLGIISQDSVLEAMGAAYGTAYMSSRMRRVNQLFFKYNGMQGWNNSMRIAATAAGERYLIANKSNDRALAELGLTSGDIKVKSDGRLDVSSPKVQQAMFRFVDQAVIRPSASNRPVWMSDPRFLLVAHLKQFTYAMHSVVLKRANRELANDNPRPWGILMLTMPVILAVDMAKFALTGKMPTNWGFMDYLTHAVERSGLLGLGDFGVQTMRGVEMGKMPGESLLGPTFENLMTILRWIGGDSRTDFGDVVNRTVPGARLI